MVHPSDGADSRHSASSEDDLGRLIRWTLEDAVSGAEPPRRVWPRILARVREMPTPTSAKRSWRRAPFPLAPFVQAVVVSALLLAFGLGLNRGVVVPRPEHRIHATPTVTRRARVSSQQFPEDVLRGYILVRMEQQQPQRLGGAIREANING